MSESSSTLSAIPTAEIVEVPMHQEPTSEFKDIADLVVHVLDNLNTLSNSPLSSPGVPSGFFDLDAFTGCFQPGELIVLASRPSMGKSTLARNISEHVSVAEGLPVAVFSMEAAAIQVTNRAVASIGRIDSMHLAKCQLTDEEWVRLLPALENLKIAPMHISDASNLAVGVLREKALRLKILTGAIGLVVVDCLQMMRGPVDQILIGLKNLAMELGCPIILTSQVANTTDARSDKRPTMFDIRDIPGLDSVPDTILFLYRDEQYTKSSCKDPGVAEVIVAKQRSGPTGVVKLAFVKAISRFESLVA